MSKVLEALCYLDDIAHGRKMDYDAHELKLIIEKELKALEIIKEKEWILVGLLEVKTALNIISVLVVAKH